MESTEEDTASGSGILSDTTMEDLEEDFRKTTASETEGLYAWQNFFF